MHQPLELGLHVRQRRQQRHLGAPAEQPCRRPPAVEHPQHLGRGGHATRARRGRAAGPSSAAKSPLGPRPAEHASTRPADHGGAAVRQQLCDRARTATRPARAARAVRERVEELRRPTGASSASSSSRRTPSRCRASASSVRAEDPQPDGRPLVDQRREHRDPVPGPGQRRRLLDASRRPRWSRRSAPARLSEATSSIACSNCGRSGALSASRSLPRACSVPPSSTTR